VSSLPEMRAMLHCLRSPDSQMADQLETTTPDSILYLPHYVTSQEQPAVTHIVEVSILLAKNSQIVAKAIRNAPVSLHINLHQKL